MLEVKFLTQKNGDKKTAKYLKKIFVKEDEAGELLIFLKFPFSMKETFDREFSTEKDHFKHSKWNQEKKLREVKFSEINVVAYSFPSTASCTPVSSSISKRLIPHFILKGNGCLYLWKVYPLSYSDIL